MKKHLNKKILTISILLILLVSGLFWFNSTQSKKKREKMFEIATQADFRVKELCKKSDNYNFCLKVHGTLLEAKLGQSDMVTYCEKIGVDMSNYKKIRDQDNKDLNKILSSKFSQKEISALESLVALSLKYKSGSIVKGAVKMYGISEEIFCKNVNINIKEGALDLDSNLLKQLKGISTSQIQENIKNLKMRKFSDQRIKDYKEFYNNFAKLKSIKEYLKPLYTNK